MTRSRFLGGAASPTPPSTAVDPTVDSNFVVILAALICSLICVLGLIAVARCAWVRRLSHRGAATNSPPPGANKGVTKKVLQSLPKETYHRNDVVSKFTECVICLMEFAEGDELRLLPQCGHGFHATCIDSWLGEHSTCPSCRKILVVTAAMCRKCRELAAPETVSTSAGREEQHQVPSFLP